MKLTRIEIEAFGGLRDCALDGIDGGLTVVLGPNEAGKSTYAALVRQVLYGYPDRRSKDLGFVPRSGVRHGRLLFADESGQWAIERVDGPKRGSVTVTALRGAERPHLLEEITGSVSEQTYRIVFGFGLDELKDIGANDDDAVVGRLYAGAHGLRVNPMDVKKELEEAAGQLFKPRGKAAVNESLSLLKDQQALVRELEAQARLFSADQQERMRLEERLAPARAEREELERAVRRLVQELAQARSVAEGAHELAQRADELAREQMEARAARERIVVNEALLAVEPEVAVALADESAMKERLARASDADARIVEIEQSVQALAVSDDVADSPEARSRLDEWRDRRSRLQAELDAAERAATASRARADSLAAAGEGESGSVRRNVTQVGFGAVLVVAGIAFGFAGIALSQLLAAALGAFVAVAGAALLVIGLRRPRNDGSLSAEAARQVAEADANERIAAAARAALEQETARWIEYLAQNHLDASGTEPAAVSALLDEARTRRDLQQQLVALRTEVARDRETVGAWTAQLVSLVSEPLGLSPEQAAADVAALCLRARDGIERALEARAQREEATRRVETLDAEATDVDKKLKSAREQLVSLSAHHHAEGDVVSALEASIAQKETDLELAREQYEELARQHTRLETRLDEQGRDASMARARQRIEGLRQQANSDADRYLVEAVALRLLESARERFERDRQPEVLRTAGRVFSAMTGGRYRDVRAPLGGNSISVISERGEALHVEQLSRGTAEQLYLALRVGLIESFGEQGPHLPVLMDDIGVNFDDERRAAACAAVADLAHYRQVVFFTCHDATAASLAEALPGATTLVLDRCSL